MKLYTEEQVKEAMLKYTSGSNLTMVQVFDSLTPIELPSDEKIIDNSPRSPRGTVIEFVAGAKWMKEQILNQKK